MIADELAIGLANEYVTSGMRVLDPFCGTARTLVAANCRGARTVGVDINPLAILIAKAKLTTCSSRSIQRVFATSRSFRGQPAPMIDIVPSRRVRWFPSRAQVELFEIVNWMNSCSLSCDVKTILGVILSATVREVSFCRKDQWKLHRMPGHDRSHYRPSAWNVFERRLRNVADELDRSTVPRGGREFYVGDATRLTTSGSVIDSIDFDLAITSPPYGDSRTTVGYGGVTSLCLAVLQHVHGLQASFIGGYDLDRRCLGGRRSALTDLDDLDRYWFGGKYHPARGRLASYLSDLESACLETAAVLAKKARAIFVVSRRSVGGKRLYIDNFIKERMERCGFRLERTRTRKLQQKNTPGVINANGAGKDPVRTVTMREELILFFGRN